MKLLIYGLTLPLALLASGLVAQETLTIDGKEYTITALTENCQSLSDEPQAMAACFTALSQLIERQSGGPQTEVLDVLPALDNLRIAAEVQNDDSGLSILGTGCTIQVVYYANYYHVSRRNVSQLDLYSVEFDVSEIQFDEFDEVRGAQAPLVSGLMIDDTTATTRGNVGLDSSANGFDAKPGRTDVGDYALEIVDQLQADEDQSFDFVLVHPDRRDDSDAIWEAFERFVDACKA